MAKVKSAPPKAKREQFKMWHIRWLAAAVCLATAFVGFMAHRHCQAERAHEQLLLALHITSQAIDMAFEAAFQETSKTIERIAQEETK
jgi:hypothetical protein